MICPSCQAENRPGARGCRQCKKALPTLFPGDVVADRFEILGLLGTGGMGAVFKATDRSLDEVVALKTLRVDLDEMDETATRFRSEIRLARKVSSRHVCRIHEYGVDGDLHYISMECVEGITVKDLLQEVGGLPLEAALNIAVQMAAGLGAIHEAGIMHRDLKPANLMRTREGVVKLMDFGIAKQLGSKTLTAAGQAVGTPEYMSPEQVTGQKLDLRTDVYAFGIVLFELLTGLVPFLGDTPLQTARKQVAEAPKLDTPGIPPALVPLLGRALAKDRAARFATAREMEEALLAFRRDSASSDRSGTKLANRTLIIPRRATPPPPPPPLVRVPSVPPHGIHEAPTSALRAAAVRIPGSSVVAPRPQVAPPAPPPPKPTASLPPRAPVPAVRPSPPPVAAAPVARPSPPPVAAAPAPALSSPAVPSRAVPPAPAAAPAPSAAAASHPRPSGRPSTDRSQAVTPPRVTEVVSALWGGDTMAKRRAVLALAELAPQSPPAVQALCEALRDSDDRVRFMAAAALGRIGPAAEAAIPALLETLDDPAASNEAAESLVRLGKAAVPALLEVMAKGKESLRTHAAATLTRIAGGQ